MSKGWQQVEKDVPWPRHNENRIKGAKKFMTLNLWRNSLACFLPHDRLLRCQGLVAGVQVKTRTGQPGHSQQVSIWSPASGGWFLVLLRSVGPCRRRGWQRADTVTAGIIPGRRRCRLGSCTSSGTCREPLRASLFPGSPPRVNHRVPSSESGAIYFGIIVPFVSRGSPLLIDVDTH